MSISQKGQTLVLLLILLGLVFISGFIYFGKDRKASDPNVEQVKYAWVQYGPDNGVIARAIIESEYCPEIKINGVNFKMYLRVGNFEGVTVCEKNLPQDTTSVSVGQVNLPAPNFHPKKILVIGDTGCRLIGKEDQNCDDFADWVLPGLAKKAASDNFDLIIHVGDYLYRESECPEGDAGCAGSPWGHNWKTLEADFFSPARPLLTKAPWLMVRGNHETCKRAGALWFAFQESDPYKGDCSVQTSSYIVNFDNLQLLYIDTSGFSDFKVGQARVDQTKKRLGELDLKNNFWLITHRPLWGVKVWVKGETEADEEEEEHEQPGDDRATLKYKNGNTPDQSLVKFNDTLESSFEERYLNMMGLSLSGHYHNLEALSFSGVVPPQLIVGNTATELEKKIEVPLDGLMINDEEVTNSKFVNGFGYMIMEEISANNWKGIEYSPEGQELFVCDIKNREVKCD